MEIGDSQVSMKDMEDAFTSQFSGPSSFYALLDQRQKRSPIYLQRHTRIWRQRRYPTGICVNLANIRDHSGNCVTTGSLLLALVSVNLQGGKLSDLIVLNAVIIEDIPSAAGTYEMLECINGSNSHLLVVMHIGNCAEIQEWPSRSETSIKSFDDSLRAFVFARISNLLHNIEKDKNSDCKICIIDLLSKKCMASSCESMNWFAPSCPTFTGDVPKRRREYILTRKPQKYSKNVVCRRVIDKKDEDISIDVAIKWTSTLRSPKRSRNFGSCSLTSSSSEVMGIDDVDSRIQDNFSSSSSSFSSQSYSPQIYHHYLYDLIGTSGEEEQRCVSEASGKLSCPWCSYHPGESVMVDRSDKTNINIPPEDDEDDKNSGINSNPQYWLDIPHQSFRILINHINNNHDYFNHEFAFDQIGNFHLVATRDTLRQQQSPEELRREIHRHHYVFGSKEMRKKLRKFAVVRTYVEQPKNALSRSDNDDILMARHSERSFGDQKRFKFSTVASRGFYHSRTGVPMHEDELGYDSDDDVDESQDLCMNNAMLEEFDDVSYEEKTFMMMWHSHLKSFRVYADLYIPYITERFARKHAPDLIRLGLRHNFLLHLITLWDYGVISSEEMENCILYVDKFALEGNLSPASPINSKFE